MDINEKPDTHKLVSREADVFIKGDYSNQYFGVMNGQDHTKVDYFSVENLVQVLSSNAGSLKPQPNNGHNEYLLSTLPLGRPVVM